MCIAIVAPVKRRVSNDALFRGWSVNNDGGGFAYVNATDELVVEKGFTKYNEFQAALTKAVEEFSDTSPFLIHMRIGSAGDRNTPINTHPFAFTPTEGPAGCLIHNGTMFQPQGAAAGEVGDKKSDSRVFADLLGDALSFDDVTAAKADIARLIGHSRMAFLYANRKYIILNEHAIGGRWLDGVWYSNSSCSAYTTGSHYNRDDFTR